MKGQVRVRFERGDRRRAVVACEFIAPATGESVGVVASDTFGAPIDLAEGVYIARATVPGGPEIVNTVKVAAGSTTDLVLVVSTASPSGEGSAPAPPPRPTGKRASNRGLTGTSAYHFDTFPLETDSASSVAEVRHRTDVDSTTSGNTGVEVPRGIWMQTWLGDHPHDAGGEVVPHGSGAPTFALSPGHHDPLFVQVGDGTTSTITAVPPAPAPTVTVVVSPSPANDDVSDVALTFSSGDPGVDALLAYIVNGRLDQARIVGPDAVAQAREMFQHKRQNPAGAAVAGYYLLRIGKVDSVGDWAANFAEWFPWLPDAQIIHAWQLLRRPDVPERDVARSRLLAASRELPPHYSEGLRLLFQGLEMFHAADPSDAEVKAHLEHVRQFASASDFGSAMTTYWGVKPSMPTLTRPTAIARPHGATDIEILRW